MLCAYWLVSVGCSTSPESTPARSINQRLLPNVVGDIAVGREIFYRREAPKCWVCHAIGDEKDRAGPNLADIASRYDRAELLDSLINPSREIADGHGVEIIETRSMGLTIGVVAREIPSLLVRNEFGDEIAVPLDEVISRRESDVSMMPDDLTDSLSDQEMVDLLVFLGSLR